MLYVQLGILTGLLIVSTVSQAKFGLVLRWRLRATCLRNGEYGQTLSTGPLTICGYTTPNSRQPLVVSKSLSFGTEPQFIN